MTTTKRIEKIENFLSELDTEIDVLNFINPEEVNNFDDIYNQINDNRGFDIEIIYYFRAINFLKDNDPSLTDSLEIASEFGFEIENLNSEVLASLLASRIERERFNELEDEINEFFNSLD